MCVFPCCQGMSYTGNEKKIGVSFHAICKYESPEFCFFWSIWDFDDLILHSYHCFPYKKEMQLCCSLFGSWFSFVLDFYFPVHENVIVVVVIR